MLVTAAAGIKSLMKLEHTMIIGDDEFTAKYSYFGHEKYFLNGKLIRKHWNLRFTGQRTFDIGGHELVIDVSVKPYDYYCKAFLDGELYVEELFPEFKERFAQRAKPASPIKWIALTVTWVAIFLFLFALFQ